ncbi:MAG: hypothetical protein GPJ54_12240 [Candidatus Heimdallarchaeota archaeon]|nr:hypothetical protein [Candidatus Heimdallarchaeota archaeon]
MSKDNFDSMFDEYNAKKRAIQEKSLTLSTPSDELPTWSDINNLDMDNICIICRKEFEDDDIVEKCIVCDVVFHSKELRQWVKTAGSCPSCKNE